jgi:ribosomal protein S18 acetylase RimI-like enzyme
MMRGSLSICGDAELPEAVDLVNAAYRGEGGRSGWTSEVGLVDGLRVTVDALRRELADTPDLVIYLLREPTGLLASVRLQDDRSHAGSAACYISMLAVRPGLQDAGIGRRMLEYAEAQGKARGARLARMTVVSVRTGLIAWYQRRGYRLTGETEPFPYDDARFGTPQRRDLEFVILQKELAE